MLEIILGILGSGGFGSLAGLVGGYFNRKLDLEAKKLEIEDNKGKRLFELDYMKSEYANKLQISTIEADAVVEAAGYAAMKESYNFAKTSIEDGLVDKISKAVRPLITISFLIGSVVIFWQLQKQVDYLQTNLNIVDVIRIYVIVIEWILFQAGVCIGWWFAMRPGRTNIFTTK